MKSIKTIPTLLIVVLSISVLIAVPTEISYQGQLNDVEGNPVEGDHFITFSIYSVVSGGDHLWIETQLVTVSNGLFHVNLGAFTSFPTGMFGNETLWLGITIEGDSEMIPRTKLVSSPYAHNAGDVFNQNINPAGIAIPGVGQIVNGAGQWVGPPQAAAGANGQIQFNNNGVFAGANLFFNPENGNLGVGVNNPEQALTVSGGSFFERDSPLGALVVTNLGSGPAISAQTTGSGYAGYFSSPGDTDCVQVIMNGNGSAIGAESNGNSPTARMMSLGSGPAISAQTTGSGYAGYFSSPGDTDCVQVIMNGNGSAIGAESNGNSPTARFISQGGGSALYTSSNGLPPTSTVTNHGGGSAASYVSGGGDPTVAVIQEGNGQALMTIGSVGIYAGSDQSPAIQAYNTGGGPGIYITGGGATATATFENYEGGNALQVNGNAHINGTLSKSSGSFLIDHPLDPANKYLYHSFVESPDMKNIYDGVVTLDKSGNAVVELPTYFQALNSDFRYQLTCIGGYAPVFIAEELADNTFRISGGESGMKVSWMVTGIRQDVYARAHPIQVEVDKPESELGTYLHPELHDHVLDNRVGNTGHK